MRNLIIKELKYCIVCDDESNYGATIQFDFGLNIIFGPNSVGKSSIIVGIIYGLGAEKNLGIFKTKQNPFKPEFYDKIDGKNIKDSHLLLEISNGSKVITIKRNIVGEINTCIIKECSISNFDKTQDQIKLIIEGRGAASEKGFQEFLFNFLDWNQVNVPKYEGGNIKLYFENLVPLFFIEQRAGWSEIQSRQVMRYGIREVKKVAFEYLMGLNKFDIHLIELQKKEILENIKSLELDLDTKESNIIILGNATVDDNKILFVDRTGHGKYQIHDLIKELKDELSQKEDDLNKLGDKKDEADTFEHTERDKLREIFHRVNTQSDKVSKLVKEISSYKNYINKIEINKKKNLQLKKINQVSDDLNISYCPICEAELGSNEEGTCKLCHAEISKISSPEENLYFLEDEKASFDKILSVKRIELDKARITLHDLKDKEESFRKKLDYQLKTYYGEDLNRIREKISEVDAIKSEIDKYEKILKQWKSLDKIREEIENLKEKQEELNKLIKDYSESNNDKKILGELLENFKNNILSLRLFKSKKELELIHQLRLDYQENYTPYLQNFDLYNISSSSDNIRIILSYYLAILQTSLSIDSDKIKFPNLLILDEPKQQNLDPEEIKSFIEITKSLPKDKWQIILTTYQKQDRNSFSDYIKYEMEDFKDFLLKKIS